MPSRRSHHVSVGCLSHRGSSLRQRHVGIWSLFSCKKRADSRRSPGEEDIEESVANENAFPEVKTELKPEGESLYGIAIITLCTFGVPVLMYFYLQAVMYTFDYTLLAMLSAPFVLIGMTVLGFYTYGYFVGSPDKTKDKNNITR